MKEQENVAQSTRSNNIFKYGTNELDAAKTRKALFNNKDAYKKTHSWSSKFNEDFDKALSFIIDGIEKGTITDVDTSGDFTYSGEASDYIDGSDKDKTKAIKAAAAYATEVMRQGVETSKLALPSKTKYQADLSEDFKKKYNAGKDWSDASLNAFIDLDPLSEDGESRDTKNRAAKYKALIDEKITKLQNGDYDMGDYSTEEELSKLRAASEALSDGIVGDNEYSILAAAGADAGDTKIIFGKGNVSVSNANSEKWKKRKEELKASGNYTEEQIDRLIEQEKLAHNNQAESQIANATQQNQDYAHNQEWNAFKRLHYQGIFNKSWNLGSTSFKSPESYENAIAKLNLDVDKYLPQWLYNPDGYTNGISNIRYLKNALDYVYKKAPEQYFTNAGDNELLVNSSIDYKTGRALVYNPATKTLKEISPAQNKVLQQALTAKWFEQNPYRTSEGVANWKNGGVLKFQTGGHIDYTQEDVINAYNNNQISKEKAQYYLQALASIPQDGIAQTQQTLSPLDAAIPERQWNSQGSDRFNLGNPIGQYGGFNILDNALSSVKARAKAKSEAALKALKQRADASGRTVEQQAEGERKIVDSKGNLQLTSREWWDVANITADVTSMIAAWVPGYGTGVSAALGYGSTISKLGHDLTDKSMSTWDAIKGLGMNLALDTVGLIPGLGTSSKTGKIVKTAAKLVPTLLATYGTIAEFKPALDALSKLTSKDGKNLTLDEWKHIGNFLTAISGANRVAASHVKTKMMASAAHGEKTNTFSIKDKNGNDIKIEDDVAKNIIKNNMNNPAKAQEELRALATGDQASKYTQFKDIELATSKKYKLWGNSKLSGVTDNTKNPNSSFFSPWDVANPTAQQSAQYANPQMHWFNRFGRWAGIRSDYELASQGGFNPFSAIREGERSLNPLRYLANYGIGQGFQNVNIKNPWTIERQQTAPQAIERKQTAPKAPQTNTYRSPNSRGNDWLGITPNARERALGIEFDKQGGKLNAISYLKSLKGNFNVESHKTGGILKAQQGGSIYQTPEGDTIVENPDDWAWYRDLYNQKVLISPELRTHNQFANTRNLYEHNLNFDLGRAAKKNDAYINSPTTVTQDLQNYYNNAYNNMSLDDFISNYNIDASKIRKTWEGDTKHKVNTQKGMREHNQLFKRMFENRSKYDSQDLYNIGYQDDLDDVMGTSTWMRRMDRYKNEWENSNKEDKLNRVHKVNLGDGTVGYVYKKANGDIARLSEEEYNKLKEETPKENAPKTEGKITPEEYKSMSDYIKQVTGYADDVISQLNPADVIAFGRYLMNDRSNRKIAKMTRAGLGVVYQSPINEHLQVIRDLNQEAEATNFKTKLVAAAEKAKTSDASTNIAAMMDATQRGAQAEMQATHAADADVKQQIKEADALDKKIYEYNIGVKQANDTADANYKKAISDINAAEQSARMQNLNTFLMEHEARIRQKRADEQAFNDQLNQMAMQNSITEDPEYKALYKQYLAETDQTKKNEILRKAEERVKQLSADAYYEYYKRYGREHNFNSKSTQEALSKLNRANRFVVDFDKKGGRLKKGGEIAVARIKARTADNKELNKAVQNGIRNHQRSLDNLSRSTLLAIKKALNQ